MPTSMDELWAQGWVADNEDQATHQAFRMFDLFHDKVIEVDRLEFQWGGEHGVCDEVYLERPYPKVVPYECEPGEWEGDVLYAMWSVRPAEPGQVITYEHLHRKNGEWKRAAKRVSLDYLDNRRWAYPLRTTAPGIGTADGFCHKGILVPPEPCDIKDTGYCSTHYCIHGEAYPV